MNEDDTFRRLTRTQYDIVLELYTAQLTNDISEVYSDVEKQILSRKQLLVSHGWTHKEFTREMQRRARDGR